MKIGPVDVSVPTLVYAAILAALAVLLPSVALSRWSAMRESWHRDIILKAVVEGGENLESGIASCRALTKADPTKAAPRLHLGCLLCSNKDYKGAADAFAQVLDASKATPEEKSLALVGQGCALCLDGSKDGKPANTDEAGRLFQKALEFKETPDALAALAILRSWKSTQADGKLEALVKKAFAAEPAPAPGALEELYKLNGTILAHARKPSEAAHAFQSVKALDPGNVKMDDIARLTLLSALNEPGMTRAAREISIALTMLDLEKFGKAKSDALMAVALAWHQLKNEPDYLEANGPFSKACAVLKQMIEFDPKDARGYRNYAALLEERTSELASALSVPVTGLNGESPRPNMWAPDVVAQPGETTVARLPKADEERVAKIFGLLRDQQAIWERLLVQPDLPKAEQINAKLRLIACARRKVLAGMASKPLRRDANSNFVLDSADSDSLNLALKSAGELAALDESGHGHYVWALLLIEKGDLPAARTALLESTKRGFKNENESKLLAVLDAKARLVDAGPKSSERSFGSAILLRAAFESPLGAGALKGIKATLDGKTLAATVTGSQVMYMPREAELSGGVHTIAFAINEASGNATNFPSFTYNVDKDPPTWSFQPGGPLKGDAVISVTVADPSGVDWASLNMGLRSLKTENGTSLDVNLIKDGHYSHGLIALKVKAGDAVLRAPFSVTNANPLPPDTYKLWIEVRDLPGNKLKDEKIISIQK